MGTGIFIPPRHISARVEIRFIPGTAIDVGGGTTIPRIDTLAAFNALSGVGSGSVARTGFRPRPALEPYPSSLRPSGVGAEPPATAE
jgi:hypothetical protein